MVRETIAADTGASLITPEFSLGDPTLAAAAYSDALRTAFGGEDPGLICLGLGEDGHTASLFPGTSALTATGTYVANHVEQLDTWRLTATFDLLWRARTLLFVVTGAAKAPVLAAIAGGDGGYPAGRAAAGAREAIWIVDAAAATDL
jgi:6-phosphogluconolactonase